MKRSNIWSILALICSFLLTCIVCLLALLSPSYLFFKNRWSNSPDWSPDGKQIVFTCHYPTFFQVFEDITHILIEDSDLFYWGYLSQATEICTTYVDGSNFTRLTHNQFGDSRPVWSPDGQLIAYLSGAGEGIHIMREDGSLLNKLADNLDVWLWSGKLRWSPDGEKISFTAEDPLHPEQGINLYLATIESGEVHALTKFPGDELDVRWSPDGNKLAFIWFSQGYGALASKSAAVWVADVSGNKNVVAEGFAGIGNLTWNPDGTQLAFWAYQTTDCVYECTEIYVVDVTSRSVECLTKQYEMDMLFEAVWSPHGDQIAFTAQGPGGVGIYTVAPDGSELSWIAHTKGFHDHDLSWSPDGKFIAFVHGIEGEKSRVWLAQVEDGSLQELNVP